MAISCHSVQTLEGNESCITPAVVSGCMQSLPADYLLGVIKFCFTVYLHTLQLPVSSPAQTFCITFHIHITSRLLTHDTFLPILPLLSLNPTFFLLRRYLFYFPGTSISFLHFHHLLFHFCFFSLFTSLQILPRLIIDPVSLTLAVSVFIARCTLPVLPPVVLPLLLDSCISSQWILIALILSLCLWSLSSFFYILPLTSPKSAVSLALPAVLLFCTSLNPAYSHWILSALTSDAVFYPCHISVMLLSHLSSGPVSSYPPNPFSVYGLWILPPFS